jgi:hypothetical protein
MPMMMKSSSPVRAVPVTDLENMLAMLREPSPEVMAKGGSMKKP